MWTLRSEDRLKEWKDFRQKISDLSFEEALNETVKLWGSAPFVIHYLDRIELKDWPTPWELLTDNKYDDLAKSLGMLYTLFLSDHGRQHTFSIIRVQENTELEYYNLVEIDSGKYILNYSFNEVTSYDHFKTDAILTNKYSSDDLKLYKY